MSEEKITLTDLKTPKQQLKTVDMSELPTVPKPDIRQEAKNEMCNELDRAIYERKLAMKESFEEAREGIIEAIIEEKRHEIVTIQKSYHLDIIDELHKYSSFVVPILDMNMLEQSLSNDPEYTIYKTRKVADAITSKIYSQYESNSHAISFNDKIRYLSYEKKYSIKLSQIIYKP